MTRKICSVLSMVVFLGLLVIAGFLFVPKMLGYDEYAVLSGSMEPGIPVGAIVYDKNFAASEAREGAVVTYQLPAGTLVTHRIISVDKEEQTVVTQGDANNIADAAPVAWQQIIGVYAFHIPWIYFHLCKDTAWYCGGVRCFDRADPLKLHPGYFRGG